MATEMPGHPGDGTVSADEPMQDEPVAWPPPQQWTGQDQMPTERSAVSGRPQRQTQLLPSSRAGQVRPEAAEQHQVRGGERLRCEQFKRSHLPTPTLSPPLANQTHVSAPESNTDVNAARSNMPAERNCPSLAARERHRSSPPHRDGRAAHCKIAPESTNHPLLTFL